MKIRIYYHHTDCGGVVYYANYLNFLEEARTEFFEKMGVSIKELTRQGILFVVARQEIDYKSPAVYGDTLDIETWVSDFSKVRLNFVYTIKNQAGQLICEARTVLVFVDKKLKPNPMPEHIREKLPALKRER